MIITVKTELHYAGAPKETSGLYDNKNKVFISGGKQRTHIENRIAENDKLVDSERKDRDNEKSSSVLQRYRTKEIKTF